MRLDRTDWTLGVMIAVNVLCLTQLWKFKTVKHPNYNHSPYHDMVPVVDPVDYNIPTTEVDDPSPAVNDVKPNVDVFYHVYLHHESDRDRVSKIVSDQFQFLSPNLHRNVFVTNVGAKLSGVTEISDATNITLLQHMRSGPELISLHALWAYCEKSPESLVAYLHSKGSFHPGPKNDKLRQSTTMSVLSEECSNLPEDCDVCGMRVNPFPHVHVPGNMFLARCSYVRKLLDPGTFDKVMGEEDSTYYGTGRYAAEHWVMSHPSARGCDVYGDTTYMYGYDGTPTVEELARNFSLAKSPRFPLDVCVIGSGRSRRIQKQYPSFTYRMEEYKRLYNATPAQDWWGWDFFERKANISDFFPPRLFWTNDIN